VCHDTKVGEKEERADNSPRRETGGRQCILADIWALLCSSVVASWKMRSPLGDDMGTGVDGRQYGVTVKGRRTCR